MEVRHYLAVLIRRWPVLAIIIGLAALLSAFSFLQARPVYTTEVRLLVRQQPAPDNVPFFTYERYYSWFSSEFLVDDYTGIVTSRAFASRVAAQLQQAPRVADGSYKYGIDTRGTRVDDVLGTISSDRKHRLLTIRVQTGSFGMTSAIANAAADVLTAEGVDTAAPDLNNGQIRDQAEFGLLDNSDANSVRSSRTRAALDALVRLALGVVAALALVVLLEYFDDRLRDEAEAEQLLQTPILGRIPGR